MSYPYRLIILYCLLCSSSVNAYDLFVDALYWRATETVDWVLTNNLSTPSQINSYRTMSFDYAPGFRLGASYQGNWDSKLYYTKFYTKATDSAAGNLTSTFLGGKLVQGNAFFYRTGNADLTINYNMIDWDVGKRFNVSDIFMLRPIIGLRGAWIKQTIVTSFVGTTSVAEAVKNNFTGIGPKAGVESKIIFRSINNDYKYSLIADFSTAYLWGNWQISDVLNTNTGQTVNILVNNRNFGAFVIQALVGIQLDYKRCAIKLGYEISDWFNQYQVFDDGTGAHNNNLILQGLTLRLAYTL